MAMQARDSSGRQVSLLNDDQPTLMQGICQHEPPPQRLSYRVANSIISQSYNPVYSRSTPSSPNTPELLRSDSYDSQASNEPLSPLTPSMPYEYSRSALHTVTTDVRSPYEDYVADSYALSGAKRLDAMTDGHSSSYEEDSAPSPSSLNPAERSSKRYPCRYRDSHGCEKTFTTSGHASRHSKIHTAEKAVHCTFHGCSKKFTRADNMKQHLETHFKEKSRSSGSRPSLSSGDRRSSSSSKLSSRSKVAASAKALPSPGHSPAGGAWDMRALNLPLLSRPSAARTPSSGLDALAMAIACQEGTA